MKRVLVCLAVLSTIVSAGHAAVVNVAASVNGGVANADSVGSYIGISGYASHAIDGAAVLGDARTSWCGTNVPGWLEVQFDQTYLIGEIGLWWTAHNHTFSVSLSRDGLDWTTVVASRQSGTNAYYDYPPYDKQSYDYGQYHATTLTHELFVIPAVEAQYMRVDITSSSAPGSHIFQTMIGEVEAYTVPEPATMALLAFGGVMLRRRTR